MRARLIAAGALALALGAGMAGPALADFSACDSAFTAKDLPQRIDLWTLCITKSGLTGAERAGAFNNRGIDYNRIGREDKAFLDFTWAIEADPYWGTAYLNRGLAYERRQDWPHALADFDKAAHLDPVDVRPHALLAEARLLLDCPDASVRNPAKAVEAAKASLRYRDDAATHDVLASAYAAAGHADDAAREESRAVELATRSGEHLDEYKTRLDQLKAKAGAQSSG